MATHAIFQKNKMQAAECYILLFLPISEWISLLVIPLSFSVPRSSLNLHFPQARTGWTQLSYTASWNAAASEFTFPFFSSIESRNLALGVTLGRCWQRSTAGWHLSPATAELKYSVPSSKPCIKQTSKQTKSLPRFLQKQFEAEVNLRKCNVFFFSGRSSIRRIRIKYHVDCALNSAQISLNCDVKNVRQQLWPV